MATKKGMPKWLSKGGKARAKKLTPAERKSQARKAAIARWKRKEF